MYAIDTEPQAATTTTGLRDLILSWLCVATTPVWVWALLQASDSAAGDAPAPPGPTPVMVLLWSLLVAAAVAGIYWGVRALRRGRTSGVIPVALGAVVCGLFLIVPLLSVIAHSLFGIE